MCKFIRAARTLDDLNNLLRGEKYKGSASARELLFLVCKWSSPNTVLKIKIVTL